MSRGLSPGSIGLVMTAIVLGGLPALAAEPMLVLHTHHFPTAIPLKDGEQTRQVTRFALWIDVIDEKGGKGSFVVEEEKLTFNDFGDPRRIDGKAATVYPVHFKAYDEGKRYSRQVFDIVFEDNRIAAPLRFAWFGNKANVHYLSMYALKKNQTRHASHLWELRPLKSSPDALGEQPQSGYFRFETFDRTGCINLTRTSSDGRLCAYFDPNGIILGDDFWSEGTTLLASEPFFARLKSIGADPAKLSRRAFRLDSDDSLDTEYILVLAATDLGPHRLLVKKKGTLQQILPLKDLDRETHIDLQKSLSTVPANEQEAIGRLRQLRGFTFRFGVENKHVTNLASLCADAADLDPVVKRLPNLSRLEFNGARIPADSLKCLADLKGLEQLEFKHCEIDDKSLKNLSHAPTLKKLTFKGTSGIKVTSLAYFEKLSNLESLTVERYDADLHLQSQPYFDEGMKHLKGLTKLKSLHFVERLTDAGVAHLADLKNLEELILYARELGERSLKTIDELQTLKSLSLPYWNGSKNKLEELHERIRNRKMKVGP